MLHEALSGIAVGFLLGVGALLVPLLSTGLFLFVKTTTDKDADVIFKLTFVLYIVGVATYLITL